MYILEKYYPWLHYTALVTLYGRMVPFFLVTLYVDAVTVICKQSPYNVTGYIIRRLRLVTLYGSTGLQLPYPTL